MNKSFKICTSIMLVLFILVTGCSKNNQETAPSGATSPTASSAATDEKPKEVTLTYLQNWNGSGSVAPADPINNPVAKALKEKTGVTLETEYATSSESEKLNLLFASGNENVCLINTAFWGGQDPTTQTLKKAAKEGQLLPLDDLIDKYGPNLKAALTEGVAKDFREYDLEDPAFNGKHYIIPWQTAKAEEDVTNWGYSVFARKDILDALKVNPSDIKSSDDIYELLKKIKHGGFKDINGQPVIPAGSWANGWPLDLLYNSYREVNFTGYSKVDGKYTATINSPWLDKQVLFMRKLVSERLLDPEAFRQNDTIAKEKLVTGRIAVLPSNYPSTRDLFKTTLYASHPEMEYVPIGPIKDAKGDYVMPNQLQLKGRAGTPALALSSSCKDPVAAIKFLDYINSDEGRLLVYYGIEGTHYTMVDGKPRFKKEWLDKYKENVQNLRNEGIRSVYTWFITLDSRMSKFGEMDPGGSEIKDEAYEKVKAMYPLKFVDGFRISYFEDGYKGVKPSDTNTVENENDVLQKAYFAKSDEAALKILNDYREQYKKSGGIEFEKYLNDKAATRNDIIN